MTYKIIVWKDHHLGIAPIKTITDLYRLLTDGTFWNKATEERDEVVLIEITIKD